MSFASEYYRKSIDKDSRISVGLDPDITKIPLFIREKLNQTSSDDQYMADAFFEFNKFIIDIVAELVPVVKPQLAYYENAGWQGLKSYYDTINYAHKKNLLVISDAKRGDIGSTSSAYASSFLTSKSHQNTDALTVNPFLGNDTLQPFFNAVKNSKNGIFILVKTSNRGSADLQDLNVDNKNISEIISDWINLEIDSENISNGNYSNIGAVIGATYPEQLSKFRKLLNRSLFLVPGVGAQGGNLDEIYRAFDDNGNGAIINSSRGILYPQNVDIHSSYEEYTQAVLEAVMRLNDGVNNSITKNI